MSTSKRPTQKKKYHMLNVCMCVFVFIGVSEMPTKLRSFMMIYSKGKIIVV